MSLIRSGKKYFRSSNFVPRTKNDVLTARSEPYFLPRSQKNKVKKDVFDIACFHCCPKVALKSASFFDRKIRILTAQVRDFDSRRPHACQKKRPLNVFDWRRVGALQNPYFSVKKMALFKAVFGQSKNAPSWLITHCRQHQKGDIDSTPIGALLVHLQEQKASGS